jgi:transcriptional regulator with XRE-family HTH domain
MVKAKRDKDTCVRAARKLLKLSQPELANEAGVGQKTVGRAEQVHTAGDGNISDDTVTKLLDFFSSKARDLFEAVGLPTEDLPKNTRNLFIPTDFFVKAGEYYVAMPGASAPDERVVTIKAICKTALKRANS